MLGQIQQPSILANKRAKSQTQAKDLLYILDTTCNNMEAKESVTIYNNADLLLLNASERSIQ